MVATQWGGTEHMTYNSPTGQLLTAQAPATSGGHQRRRAAAAGSGGWQRRLAAAAGSGGWP
jgi:hypothetical protein